MDHQGEEVAVPSARGRLSGPSPGPHGLGPSAGPFAISLSISDSKPIPHNPPTPPCRTHYDAIIIGAGHNGLVTAAYLAKAGYKVLVLERRDIVGGCCITEELWPGFKVSTAAYVNSLLRPEIIRDLELKKYGFEMLPRSPSSFTPFPDGRYLMMGPDKEMTHREIAKFSAKDAEATRSTRTCSRASPTSSNRC